MTLVIQIALGIVLAVVILWLLRAFAVYAPKVIIALLSIGAIAALAYYSWQLLVFVIFSIIITYVAIEASKDNELTEDKKSPDENEPQNKS